MIKQTVLLICLLALAPAMAADLTADDFVRHNSKRVIDAIEASRGTFDEAPGPLYAAMDTILEDAIDFEAIARGVIGRHGHLAQPNHLTRFTKIFRKSLVELVSKAMVALRAEAIDVSPAQSLAGARSKVTMQVTTEDDAKFQLSYALVKSEHGWRVRNIVINGVNVGLTYRNQFDALMRKHDGDISQAIAHWQPMIEETTQTASG